jgi:hypothetical protein
MKNTPNMEILKKHFNFLTSTLKFKIKDIEDHNYGLYVKFISNDIGIYFIFEFRDFIPDIQFAKLDGHNFEERKGLYTIIELYKDRNFKLRSFYLSEILNFKYKKEYRSYFQNIKTIKDAIRICSELVQTYAMDFIEGNELSYAEMDKWYRTQVEK